jgi:hypothetical protein
MKSFPLRKSYENKPSNLPARVEKKGVVAFSTIAGVMPAPLSATSKGRFR